MASRSLVVRDSLPTTKIDMGSSHRAVKTRFELEGVRYLEKGSYAGN